MSERSSCIFIVDNEPAAREAATHIVLSAGLSVQVGDLSDIALTSPEQLPCALILVDRQTLNASAFATLRNLRSLHPDLPIVLTDTQAAALPADTARDDAPPVASLPDVIALGIQGLVWKPWQATELHSAVAQALEQARRRARVATDTMRSRVLMDHAADAVFLLDDQGTSILDANPAAERMSGYPHDELLQLQPHTLLTGLDSTGRNGTVPPRTYPLLLDDVYNSLSNPEQVASALRMKNGRSIPVSASISRIPADDTPFLLVIVRDMSNGWRLAQQQVQREKLAAIGRLVSSIAHEINNPLQAIHNSLHLLINRSHNGDMQKRERYLAMAQNEVDHLIGIVQRVMEIYRPSREGMRLTDLNEVIQAALTLMHHRLQSIGIEIVSDWTPTLPRVYGISSHLKQLCISLILNAAESMPSGGTLAVRTYVTRAGVPQGELAVGQPTTYYNYPSYAVDISSTAPGDADATPPPEEVVIEFSDTGRGIPPDELEKMFEPFYTTRNNSVGLGLALSYGIVEQHRGKIAVSSVVGSGTTVRLYLPIPSPDERPG